MVLPVKKERKTKLYIDLEGLLWDGNVGGGSWRGEMVGGSLGVLSWCDNDVIARGRNVGGGWLSSFRPGVICLA